MENKDFLDKLAGIAGKSGIEKKRKREIIEGKDGRDRDIKHTEEITGLDGSGAITADELKRIREYHCSHPSKGIENYGGKCMICGDTFCNEKGQGQQHTCSRRCMHCHRRICMRHVRGMPGDPVYCSLRCLIFFKIRQHPMKALAFGLVGVVLLCIVLAILFANIE